MEIEINIYEESPALPVMAMFEVTPMDVSWMWTFPQTAQGNPTDVTLEPGRYEIRKLA